MGAHPEDHFSALADRYQQGRFGYPASLYVYLHSLCGADGRAWDCATGSGQAAHDLAAQFAEVIATDISPALLGAAEPHPRIHYRQASAERSGLPTASVDIVTVAQAIHWFHLDAFWAEAQRVLKPGGVLAFWGYTNPEVDATIDPILQRFGAIIAGDWPRKSRLLHRRYKDLHPPFARLQAPPFVVQTTWSVDQLLAHLSSWSATRYFHERTGACPLATVEPDLRHHWGSVPRPVRWPLAFKAYRTGNDTTPDP